MYQHLLYVFLNFTCCHLYLWSDNPFPNMTVRKCDTYVFHCSKVLSFSVLLIQKYWTEFLKPLSITTVEHLNVLYAIYTMKNMLKYCKVAFGYILYPLLFCKITLLSFFSRLQYYSKLIQRKNCIFFFLMMWAIFIASFICCCMVSLWTPSWFSCCHSRLLGE